MIKKYPLGLAKFHLFSFPSGKSFFQGLIFILFSNVYSLQSEFFFLPRDEDEAIEMMKKGLLDSTLWNLVEPYYFQPLCVPCGELRILKQVFPDLPQNLPCTDKELVKYIPWNRLNVNIFYKDFPELRNFSPILDFSSNSAFHIGRAGFFIRRTDFDSSYSHAVQFQLDPFSKLRLDGRFDLTEKYARWKNRTLIVRPSKKIEFQVGNFDAFDDAGLVYGYFPDDKNADSSLYNNWFYGTAEKWNGMSVSFRGFKKSNKILSNIQTFYHKRSTESIYGLNAGNKNKLIDFDIGVSGLALSGDKDSLYYLHGGVNFHVSNFSAVVQSSINLNNPVAVPISGRLFYKELNHRYDVEILYLPTGFHAPRSSVVKSITVAADSFTIHKNTFLLKMKSVHTIGKLNIYSPEIALTFRAGLLTGAITTLEMSGTAKQLDYSLHYSFQPAKMEIIDSLRHVLTVNFMENLSFVTLQMRYDAKFVSEIRSYGIFFSPEFKISEALLIAPLFKYSKNSSEKMFLGIREKLELFKKVNIETKMELPLPVSSWETLYVTCTSWFIF